MPARLHRHTTRLVIGFALGALVLSCGACGRRGALEPPDSGAAERKAASRDAASSRSLSQGVNPGMAVSDPDEVRDGDEVAESATAPGVDGTPALTSRGAKRRYTIPKQPFFLDPIL